MNPYGTSVPFLFGEDPASQEAQRSFGEAAGKVGEFILGSGEPMKVDGQPVATGEPFFGLLGPTGVTQLGGLRQLSRFRPRATQATDAPMLPVLRQGQAPAVPGGRPPAVRPTGTIVPSAPAAPTSNLLRDLAAAGATIGGTAALVNQFSGDKQNEAAPTLPQEVSPTVAQPQLTTVPGLEGGFGGMSLSEFLEPVRAEREAARSAFEEASRAREARQAQEEAGRRMQEARSRGEIGGGLGDYMSLARAAGATGGAVKTMAEQLRTQAEQQAATTQAELETEAKKQETYQARIDALQEEKPDESTAAIGRIDNLISRGILPADKRNEAILSELGLDPNELLGSGLRFDPSTLSARDKEAYDFAIKNPEDSRSKEILERLGAS